MDFLLVHLFCLEAGFGGDCGKCVAKPFDYKVRAFSSKQAS